MSLDRRSFIVSSAGLVLSASSRVLGKYVPYGSTPSGILFPYRTAEGTFHAHTNYSNRGQFGEVDYDHANAPTLERIIASIEYIGPWIYILTDHSEQMTASHWRQRESDLLTMKRPWAIYRAFEWTLGGAINNPNCCHVTVMGTDRYVATQKTPVDFGGDIVTSYRDLWGWLNTNLGSLGMWGFPHPWIGKYQFDDFALAPQQLARDRCCWVEVCGGPTNRSIKDGIPFLIKAVEKGWHVAPVMGSDNFGDINREKSVTGVSSNGDLTQRSQLYKYIRERRMYVSDIPDSRFAWSISKSGVPQSEVLLGGTFDARTYGFPDVVDYVVNHYIWGRLSGWELYFIGSKHPFAQGRAPDEPPGAILKYQERVTPRPTAVIFCLIFEDGKRILGAPIWIQY